MIELLYSMEFLCIMGSMSLLSLLLRPSPLPMIHQDSTYSRSHDYDFFQPKGTEQNQHREKTGGVKTGKLQV